MNQVPILILGKESKETMDKFSGLSAQEISVLRSPGIEWRRSTQEPLVPLEDQGDFHPADWVLDNMMQESQLDHQKKFLEQFILVEKETTASHRIANIWGAHHWAVSILGIDSPIDAPDLAVKYFLAKHQSSLAAVAEPDLSDLKAKYPNLTYPVEQELSILVMDDQVADGWETVIQHVFDQVILAGKHKAQLTTCADAPSANEMVEKIKQARAWYDLVILDLRFTDTDGYLNHYNEVKSQEGYLLMQRIKRVNPAIPVIIFTASNKAWNLDTLLDAGADGYYIKEQPEYSLIPDFSVENHHNFLRTATLCLHKSQILRSFWTQVDRIERGIAPTLVAHDGIRVRIEERLRMFFGLLKKSFELTSYDQDTFFYSAQELAFMTLWSVLNEVQEDYYDKKRQSFPIHDPRNNHTFPSHPGGQTSLFDNQMNWAIRTTRGTAKEELFISMLPELDTKADSPLMAKNPDFYKIEQHSEIGIAYKKDTKKKSTFNKFSIGKYEKRGKWDERISLQIAFLILKMPELQKGIAFYCQEKKNLRGVWEPNFLKKLYDLNDLRNKLYLTHGDTDPDFFTKTERQKRADGDINVRIQREIKDLFELVYFLLTGRFEPLTF